MCISAAMLTAAAAVGSVGATLYGIDQSRKQANRMRDAQEKVETTAAQTANARLAQRRRALAANSLVTDQSTGGMASTGRATLGGG